jgi:hypothetical protein
MQRPTVFVMTRDGKDGPVDFLYEDLYKFLSVAALIRVAVYLLDRYLDNVGQP